MCVCGVRGTYLVEVLAKIQIDVTQLKTTESKFLEERNRSQHLEEFPRLFTVSNGVGWSIL